MSHKPDLVLIVAFDAGTVNEIPVDDQTILSIAKFGQPLTTFVLKGVRTLVLTEAMDDLDNTFVPAPSRQPPRAASSGERGTT